MLPQLDVYHDGEPRSAAMNMAVDEALLEFARVPALRFYRWRRPSVSFGYFGEFATIAHEQSTRELVRRWTGGGIVFHGDDLTYSIVLPAAEAKAFGSSRAVYAKIHNAICIALAGAVNVELATVAAPKVSEACFANPVEADVIANGRKIAGAAQRRARAGLLHQGSIQHESLPTDFADTFAGQLCGDCLRKSLPATLLRRAEEIAQVRYGTQAWLRRR
ncbi:MAG: hypothetical protein H0U43_03715 [Chthoniobacterales bacterium]|nr:hypothetical protein [Chthoniobacterales bacterium]